LEKVQDTIDLALFTYKKWHMDLWLVPKSVTLNNCKWHTGHYFVSFSTYLPFKVQFFK